MDTSASLLATFTRTPARGWAVALLSRLHLSFVALISFTFGLFLPFVRQDLDLSPVEVGMLQGVWWITSALLSLPCSVWFSRCRPIPLILVSLVLDVPLLALQGLASSFVVLLLARLCFILCHVIASPARPLLLQQWVAPRQYALVNAIGLSQHSLLLAVAMSTSAALITAVGSWRLAYFVLTAALLVQILAWVAVAREKRAPVQGLQHVLLAPQASPLSALHAYPQGWLLGVTMLALSATWTGIVTFLPTLLLEHGGLAPTFSGPLLGFLYYGLIPGALLGGVLEKKVQNRKLLLGIPALCNMLLGIAITYTTAPWLLMILLTGMGLVWIVSPVIEVLPFELPDIRPREIAVIVSLVKTLSGLGFAIGPLVTGLVAQVTGSLQTGLLVLCMLTGLGAIASIWYPSQHKASDNGVISADLG
jgi:predicted MFS family arabinose efflux permease